MKLIKVKKILKGLKKIHSKRFIHRDLKSANIMLSVRGDVKISYLFYFNFNYNIKN